MKTIILGDLHFGVKGFGDKFFTNQLRFFDEQLFPYMKKNNIDTIIQLGDWMENRKTMDIKFLNRIIDEFCKRLVEHNIKFITFLGNHDIYYNSKLDINLVKYFGELYPDNITVLDKITKMQFGDMTYCFMPWIIDTKVNIKQLEDVDVLFGHFEIKNFEMVKGHVDQDSTLTSSFFQKAQKLKKVISGHYHVQSTDGFVIFSGTPYQLNWGDYDTPRGFFIIDGSDLDFVENRVSQKFVKVKYDDTQEKVIEIKGLTEDVIYLDSIEPALDDLKHHQVKFFVNAAKDKKYENDLYHLHQADIKYGLTNNVEISNLIGTDFKDTVIENVSVTELILSAIKDGAPQLLEKAQKMLQNINQD